MKKYKYFNFNSKVDKLACQHCNNYYEDVEFMLRLDDTRRDFGKPLKVNSGSRCLEYNRVIGSKDTSMHVIIKDEDSEDKRFAVDLCIRYFTKDEKQKLVSIAKKHGFTGIGYANYFLHLDRGRKREWYYGKDWPDYYVKG